MACKPKLTPEELEQIKKDKIVTLNKWMEAYSYPSLWRTIRANTKEEADKKALNYQTK